MPRHAGRATPRANKSVIIMVKRCQIAGRFMTETSIMRQHEIVLNDGKLLGFMINL